MGLFSTIAANGTQASSSKIPSVVQLFSDAKYIHLDTTSKVTGFTAMTYQAIQVGSSAEEEEVKNRHQNPDLGVWNCRVAKGDVDPNKQALVDSLLAKTKADTFCMTVDLSEETTVEPTLTSLQGALVRHLIEHPPTAPSPSSEQPASATATTSLYQLQATTFGLATQDKRTEPSKINESYKEIKTTLMICAVLPAHIDEVSDSSYQKKQEKALLIYHLRKFAAAINASLVFVEDETPETNLPPSSNPPSPTKESQMTMMATTASSAPTTKSIVGIEQPTVNYERVAQLWRDLALGKEVWKDSSSSTSTSDDTTPGASSEDANDDIGNHNISLVLSIYGPGQHQEDSIETVLLRNAHYPGHWDAQKDSVWVALPTPLEVTPEATGPATGDEGWLGQLRETITADTPKPIPAAEQATDEKPPKKDAAVSSFFESLLKNP
jgi:hypothetical protein